MKYFISSLIYRNGKVSVSKPLECGDDTRSTYTELKDRDIYVDVFDSWDSAMAFYNANKNA